jgi:hypothetical protein
MLAFLLAAFALLPVPSALAHRAEALLDVRVLASPARATAGAHITYRVLVTNPGDLAAENLQLLVSHELYPQDQHGVSYPPRAVSLSAPGASCQTESTSPPTYRCALARLDPGTTFTATSVELVRAPAGRCTVCTLQLKAIVSGDAGGASAVALTPVDQGGAGGALPGQKGVGSGLVGGHATPGRRGGKIALGLGDPDRFFAQTGQRSLTRHVIAGWGQGGASVWFERRFAAMGALPLLGINTGGSISPGKIARGPGDDYLVALNHAIAAWGGAVQIRPMPEMNGHWNSYCAFNADGSRRGRDYSTAAFRKAFARIYLIVHGGPGVNAKLARLGLPAVRAQLEANPRAEVVWNPQGYGSPDVPGNSAQAYYPGDAYVDVVGDDLYLIGGKAEWPAAEALYRAHPRKPFEFPEWGLWGVDDAGFVQAMAAFVRSHRRVVLISYYSGSPGSIFDLASKPRARAAYRRQIVPLGRTR